MTQLESDSGDIPPYPLLPLSHESSLDKTKQLVSTVLAGMRACRALKPYVARILINSHGVFGTSEENIGGLYAYNRALSFLTGRNHPRSWGPSSQSFDWTEFDETINSTPTDILSECDAFI